MAGRIVLGVCDADATCGWGLEPCSGALARHTRGPRGEVSLLHAAPPPLGFPDQHGMRLMATNLRGTAEGSVVELEACQRGSSPRPPQWLPVRLPLLPPPLPPPLSILCALCSQNLSLIHI